MPRCRDAWTGRYFKSSVKKLEKAITDVNLQISNEGGATLNEFYDRLEMEAVEAGSWVGWAESTSLFFAPIFDHKARPIIEVSFRNKPTDIRACTR